MSEELLTFHEVINHMQEQEEQLIDDHRFLVEVRQCCHSNRVVVTTKCEALRLPYSGSLP